MEFKEFIKELRNLIRKELPNEYSFEVIPGMLLTQELEKNGLNPVEYDGYQIIFKKNLGNGFELRFGFKSSYTDGLAKMKPIITANIKNFIEYASNTR